MNADGVESAELLDRVRAAAAAVAVAREQLLDIVALCRAADLDWHAVDEAMGFEGDLGRLAWRESTGPAAEGAEQPASPAGT